MSAASTFAEGYQAALNDLALCAAQGPARVNEWLLANLADPQMREVVAELATKREVSQ